MKEKLCLYNSKLFSDNDINKNGVFLFEFGQHLKKIGFDVTMVCGVDRYMISNEKIPLIPYTEVERYLNGVSFDYLMSEEDNVEVFDGVHFNYKVYLCKIANQTFMHVFDYIFYFSTFQTSNFAQKYYEYYLVNPPVSNIYFHDDKSKYEKKNKMVWTSGDESTLSVLLEDILPLIRVEVPDFEIDLVLNDEIETEKYDNVDGVNVFVNLSKEEIVEKQKESKIYILPNTGNFSDTNNFVDNVYTTLLENAVSGCAVVTNSDYGINEILSKYSGFIEHELLEKKGKQVFVNTFVEQSIKILKNDTFREQLSKELVGIAKDYTMDLFADEIVWFVHNMYTRDGNTKHMLENMTTRLVFHFWVPDVKSNFYKKINKLHIDCFKSFNKTFKESLFVLACDDLNDPYIEELKNLIYSTRLTGSIQIKIVQNDSVNREGKTYNDEILHKLDKLDGLTFFGHNKGTSRLESVFRNGYYWYDILVKWITFMYYFNLSTINVVKNRMASMSTITYGALLCINSNEEYKLPNKWMYMGAFHWLNAQKLYDVIGYNKRGYDPYDAELFLPSILPYDELRTRGYGYKYEFDFDIFQNRISSNRDFFEGLFNTIVTDDDLEKYNEWLKTLESINE